MIGEGNQSPAAAWQPSYLIWFLAIYIWTIVAVVLAIAATSMISAPDMASGMFASFMFVSALATVAAWPNGLLSFFLVSLTEVRLVYHGPIGGLAFGALGAVLSQFSTTGALFGAIYGLVSLAGTAGMLSLHRSAYSRYAKRKPHA